METSTDCGRFNPGTYHQINNDISRPLAMYSKGARLFMYFCTLLPADAQSVGVATFSFLVPPNSGIVRQLG